MTFLDRIEEHAQLNIQIYIFLLLFHLILSYLFRSIPLNIIKIFVTVFRPEKLMRIHTIKHNKYKKKPNENNFIQIKKKNNTFYLVKHLRNR